MDHFSISTARNNKSKACENIFISYNITDILYQTNFLDSSELTSYINECTEIVIEIQYPSSNFSNIYQKVISLKQNNSSKIKIGIFYSQMETADRYFYNNKDINYLRFDSNIKQTPNGDDSSKGIFEGCSSLIEVFIPSSLNKIGNHTFKISQSLKKINFENPSSLTFIGQQAFEHCESLTELPTFSSVTFIGNHAFQGCYSLAQISISSFVTSIGTGVFNVCSSLTQISIPSSVTSIGEYGIAQCSSLTQISFETPSYLTSIEDYAFCSNKSLTQISIPSSVTSIGKSAFVGCSSLTQITVPSKINTDNLGINSNVKINRI